MNFLSKPPSIEPSSLSDNITDALGFLDEATFGGTKFREPLRIEVVRPLTEEDLTGGHLAPAKPPSLRDIKSSHHSLAKLLAQGRSHIDASRITGYSPGYIGRLAQDETFRELILHYSTVEEIASTDFLGAMREVGLDMLSELRSRIEKNPGSLSVGQLHEGIKLLLVEPMKSEALRGGLAAGIAPISVTFVSSQIPQAAVEREGVIIEGEISSGREK